jgi:phosphate transport system permease protein
MTDLAQTAEGRPMTRMSATAAASPHMTDAAQARLRARYRAEKRFQYFGLGAVVLGVASLVFLLWTILSTAFGGLWQTYITLEVPLARETVGLPASGVPTERDVMLANWNAALRQALFDRFPEVTSRADRNALGRLVSEGAVDDLRRMVAADPSLVGRTISFDAIARSDIDLVMKGKIDRALPEGQRRVDDRTLAWMDELVAAGAMELRFNARFFTGGNSSSPELVGIWGAVVGSFMVLLVTALLAVPVGVMAAIYLQEFAPKNRFTDLIEMNINNLAAVPSIVFGLLGLAVFINFFGMPRSAPIVGGVVIALMSLPVIIIATRAALRAVPPSIREAALGVGASKMQVILHHVLPLAAPGILTGTIIAMANALGETAPLLLIGMNAFLTDIPSSFTSSATVIPVQIFSWSRFPERGFEEKTALAIVVLLVFLLAMNALAIYLRKKFERRW